VSAKTLKLEIVTPDGSTFAGDVESVIIPAWEGLLGVLPGREPLVAALKAGELSYKQDGRAHFVALSGGFAQVSPGKVVVLAETAELAGQIDAARAKAKLEQKQAALKGAAKLSEEQVTAIQAGLLKELIRIKLADKSKRN
jgi:F-type H+-transporting ATPase subunit epsilon